MYQAERYGNFSYAITGLTANDPHTVRLHFAEIYFSSTGQRTFDVTINGTQVLSGYDIYAQAGAKDKAVVEAFAADADGSGQIVIQFDSVVNNAKCSGIEVLTSTPTSEQDLIDDTTYSARSSGWQDGTGSTSADVGQWKVQYYDGSSWQDLFAYKSADSAGWHEEDFADVQASKVRVYFKPSGAGYPIGCDQLNVGDIDHVKQVYH